MGSFAASKTNEGFGVSAVTNVKVAEITPIIIRLEKPDLYATSAAPVKAKKARRIAILNGKIVATVFFLVRRSPWESGIVVRICTPITARKKYNGLSQPNRPILC